MLMDTWREKEETKDEMGTREIFGESEKKSIGFNTQFFLITKWCPRFEKMRMSPPEIYFCIFYIINYLNTNLKNILLSIYKYKFIYRVSPNEEVLILLK